MGVPLTPEVQSFLRQRVFAHLSTLMKDGSPQVTPVWVNTDGKDILINTAAGRLKARNMQRDGRVALSIMGLESPNRTVFIRGLVKEITEIGARDHINQLSAKYTGRAQYNFRDEERRLKVVIEPLHVSARGLTDPRP